ncbi:hypothetical protein NDN08_000492 [Rhodosorus marinus]|uniref:G domain-containing protein n=1 Tax=Rhodosorus marinus TaxID=101924 RepID=A0AAV8UR48_9RHOD|nr:hypothetical protein NDN08_000492 [Rhodosorus marinus]
MHMQRMGSSEADQMLKQICEVYSFLMKEREDVVYDSSEIELVEPRRRVNVMIVGNHSVGKSSFINWYMETDALRTGVAMESSGFSIVTQGKRRQSLKGNATINAFRYLQSIASFEGSLDHLRTEVVPEARMGKHLVTFFDTPGLTDGEHQYPFPVEQIILELAKSMDLILVFYDPVGQGLCSRTSRVVGTLNRLFRNKLRFYLTKADTIDNPEDGHKIIFQVAQNLPVRDVLRQSLPKSTSTNVQTVPSQCKNHAASLAMISLPHFYNDAIVDVAERHIDCLRADIDKAVDEKVQVRNSSCGQSLGLHILIARVSNCSKDELLRAINDTDQILKSLEMSDQMQTHAVKHNSRIVIWRTALAMIATTASVSLSFCIITVYDAHYTRSCLESVLPKAILESEPRRRLLSRWQVLYPNLEMPASAVGLHARYLLFCFMCYYILLMVFLGVLWFVPKKTTVLTSKQRAKLKAHKERVQAINLKSKDIYAAYISESMNLDSSRHGCQASPAVGSECELQNQQSQSQS